MRTHVILTPGACGREVPSRGRCHLIRGLPRAPGGSRWLPRAPRELPDEFLTYDSAADVYRKIGLGTPWKPPGSQVFKDLPERSHNEPQGDPEGPQERPRAPQGIPKRSSMASPRDTKVPPGTQKGTQRRSIYTKTPDQPHQRPLCYYSIIILYYYDSIIL